MDKSFLACLFLFASFLSGCWSEMDYDYDHEIFVGANFSDVPKAMTNCIEEIESRGFFVVETKVSENFFGSYKVHARGLNAERFLEKRYGVVPASKEIP